MKSFSRHKPNLLIAIYNFFFPEIPQNLNSYTDITPKTYRNGFFFKPQKSEIILEMKLYPFILGCILLTFQSYPTGLIKC